jgi:hypothetical protein
MISLTMTMEAPGGQFRVDFFGDAPQVYFRDGNIVGEGAVPVHA